MKRLSTKAPVWACGVALSFGTWLGWPTAGHALDLRQAYETALSSDATLRAARAATDAQRERLPQARAQLYPNVVLGIGRNSNDLQRTQTLANGRSEQSEERYASFNQTLTVRQPLFRKPLWVGLEQAGYLVQEADAMLARELQNLAVRVSGAYLEALLAQDQLDLVEVQRRHAEAQLRAARQLRSRGSGTRTEVDEAVARLDLLKAQALEATEHVQFTRRQLERILDRPVTPLAALDASKLPLEVGAWGGLDRWLALSDEHSPELKALRARREAARLEIDKAQGGHWPTLDAIAQFTRSGSENVNSINSSYINRSLGFQLNVPIYSGGGLGSVVRQATAEWTRTDELLEAARRDLHDRVHQEYRGVTEGAARIRALEQAVLSAEQWVVSNRRSFEAGMRTLTDIQNAEERRQQALLDLARARYLFVISGIRLRALAGLDLAEAIQEANEWLALPAQNLSAPPAP
jgi:outer membrane protein, protease secretion system